MQNLIGIVLILVWNLTYFHEIHPITMSIFWRQPPSDGWTVSAKIYAPSHLLCDSLFVSLFVQPCLVHPRVLQDLFSMVVSCQNESHIISSNCNVLLFKLISNHKKEIEVLEVTDWYLIWLFCVSPIGLLYSAPCAPPCTDMSSALLLCQWLSDRSPCANHRRTQTAQSGPRHAKVTSQMDLNCNIANVPTRAANVNPLEQAIILCFVLKHLGYCYRSLGESYSWETDSRVVFSSCFYYCISGRRANRLPVLAKQELY